MVYNSCSDELSPTIQLKESKALLIGGLTEFEEKSCIMPIANQSVHILANNVDATMKAVSLAQVGSYADSLWARHTLRYQIKSFCVQGSL